MGAVWGEGEAAHGKAYTVSRDDDTSFTFIHIFILLVHLFFIYSCM